MFELVPVGCRTERLGERQFRQSLADSLTLCQQVYWMPLCLKSLQGLTADGVGSLAAVIYLAAMLGMGVCARQSDGSGRHARFLAASMALACAGFCGVALALRNSAAVAVVVASFCVVACGLWGVMGPFWGLVPLQFNKAEAPVGIALVNSMGVAGSFAGPLVVAALVGGSNNFISAFAVSAILAAASAAAAVAIPSQAVLLRPEDA